jgi:hypothetical protein
LALESVGDVTRVSLWQGYFATGARLERADGQCQPSRTREAMCRASAA